MRGPNREAFRLGQCVWLGLSFLFLTPLVAAGGRLTVEDARVHSQGDSLLLDVRLDSLFSARSLEAIETGMTTTIDLELRVLSQDGRPMMGRKLALRLDHDIWEGEYRVTRHASVPETLLTASFEEAALFCTSLGDVNLGPTDALEELDQEDLLLLQVRAVVNPVSPEQEARTRRWLDFLERGSLLELFISLETTSAPTPWVDVVQFQRSTLADPPVPPEPQEAPQ